MRLPEYSGRTCSSMWTGPGIFRVSEHHCFIGVEVRNMSGLGRFTVMGLPKVLCYLSASIKDPNDAIIQELQVPFYSQSRDSVQSTNYNNFDNTTSPPLKIYGEKPKLLNMNVIKFDLTYNIKHRDRTVQFINLSHTVTSPIFWEH